MRNKLHRSTYDSMIGGVCGGLAETLDVDTSIIRLIAVLLLLFGPGMLIYIIMWIILPQRY